MTSTFNLHRIIECDAVTITPKMARSNIELARRDGLTCDGGAVAITNHNFSLVWVAGL